MALHLGDETFHQSDLAKLTEQSVATRLSDRRRLASLPAPFYPVPYGIRQRLGIPHKKPLPFPWKTAIGL